MIGRSALAVLALWLAACSSGQETSEAKVDVGSSNIGRKDACEMMTLADVQEVYGHPMKKAERNIGASGPSADVSMCTYQSEDALHVATLMVTVSKATTGMLASRDAYALSAEKDVPAELRKELAVEKVEFQGHPALWQAGQLKVFKNGVMASVLADPASGKDAKQTIEAIMVKVVPRI